jgi:selenocysteine lyase/cysteine desulfurase
MLRVAGFAAAVDPYFAELRQTEFGRLDRDHHAYLDYTGAALYAERQLAEHHAMLCDSVLGNPHSESTSSRASTAIIERARRDVLAFLDADPDEYAVIFTANASAAIKLVGESYPFGPDGTCILAADNHNSINGLREYARRSGARVRYVGLNAELRLADPAGLLATKRDGPSLFAFPAQSNFSGVRHPLDLCRLARAHGCDVLLDAAAFVPTSRLSLREVAPDFVALSFYKIFGYPTGVGALVARLDALHKLRRPWFAGGTVEYASVQNDTHRLRARAVGFEDGTPDFLSIAGLAPGFAFMNEVGIDRLHTHVASLTALLLDDLRSFVHSSGQPVVRIYGPATMDGRGAAVAFNVLDPAGRPVPYAVVEARAREAKVCLRGGCFCNPGASEFAFGFPAAAAADCFRASESTGFTEQRFSACLGREFAVGAVRASMGLASNVSDVRRVLDVVAGFRC